MRMLLRLGCAFLLFSSPAIPQSAQEESGYFRHPLSTSLGIVTTDDMSAGLYLLAGDSLRTLVSSPGVGNYASVSPEGSRIGMKLIGPDGKQVPAIIDVGTSGITRLWQPADRIGQVSFSDNGEIAFTVGEELVVIDGGQSREYTLGVYANSAPISPDGRRVVFNDADDQLWTLDLLTGSRALITDGAFGYFRPVWSPNSERVLYSSLHGILKVFDIPASQTFTLGEGSGSSWSADSRHVVFHRLQIADFVLENSDIFLSDYTGSTVVRLTDTPAIVEMDPAFLKDGTRLVFHTYTKRELVIATLTATREKLDGSSVVYRASSPLRTVRDGTPRVTDAVSAPMKVNTMLDIPYLHQVYDTPDWFNGHAACAPTTAMMALAYYNVLPVWDAWCSGPWGHASHWGRYICEEYTFKGRTYSAIAEDPNGKPSKGGYGYMWVGSNSPYSTMAGYISNHGIPASRQDGPPHSAAIAELQAGYPYSMCVALTTSGHLVLAHGIGAEQHTLIVNDPYGNKNSGYMNYYGKNAAYDWPGYNNGNQNFNTVWWCVTSHGQALTDADTLVDDLQIDHGFYLHTQAPASMALWKDQNRGYRNHIWFTFTRGTTTDTCYAIWRPNLPQANAYEVLAYIPISTATDARYVIHHASGVDTVSINQKNVVDAWVSLGSYWFNQGNTGYVRLGDASSVRGEAVVFDAVRWQLTSTAVGEESLPVAFELKQNYPNPFNSSTTIHYAVPVGTRLGVSVFDVLGREVATLVDEEKPAGAYTVQFKAADLASGLYFYRLTAGAFTSTKKALLVR